MLIDSAADVTVLTVFTPGADRSGSRGRAGRGERAFGPFTGPDRLGYEVFWLASRAVYPRVTAV